MFNFKQGYYADVRIEDRSETLLRFKNGEKEEFKQKNAKKAFIRVYDGEMWYYASTADSREENVQKQLDSLYAYAKRNDGILNDPIVKRYECNRDVLMRFKDNCVLNVPIEEKQERLLKYISLLKGEHVMLNYGTYLDRYSVFEFYSSKGAEIKYDYQTSGTSLSVSLSYNGEQFSHGVQKAGSVYSESEISEKEIKDAVSEAERYITTAKKVEPGVYPVVLAPIATGVFAHESFGHKSEADFMVGDEQMAKDWQIGKKVGSDILTIYETGTIPGSGYTPYDDEGTKAKLNYLIKDGYLAGRLHSASTAAIMGENLTGNARAINCEFEPIVRMTNTIIKGGTSTVDELISGIKHGFFIKNISHGSGMSMFTIAPTLAYEIVDGKIGEPVKIAVLTGNVFETLGLIDGVANDETVLSFVTGGCGKMEQYPLPVGFGGPHIRISKMNVQ